ncbi:MAG: hypothetical protein ACJAUC_004542, partial [Planctomycetota bacterium]
EQNGTADFVLFDQLADRANGVNKLVGVTADGRGLGNSP